MANVFFKVQFTSAQIGKTGLTVTVDVDRYTISSGAYSALVTAGAATEARNGVYFYYLASADLALYEYVAVFKTTNTTVDQQQIAVQALVVPDALTSAVSAVVDYASVRAAVGLATANLDTQLDALPTAAEIVAAIDADPPAVNVTLWKDATAPGLIAGVGAGSGTGYYSDTLESPGGMPVDGARVMLATDEDGLNVAYEARSDAFGVFEMRPDPGTYYCFIEAAGHTFTQGVEVLVEEA